MKFGTEFSFDVVLVDLSFHLNQYCWSFLLKFGTEFPFDLVLVNLAFHLISIAEASFCFSWGGQATIFRPEIMPSWGLKYYPICGFDCGQVFNKRHVRKHGFGKADNLGFDEQAQI